MIFYFSGTGNSKWIASEVAKLLNDETKNISDIKEDEKLHFEKDENVGIVFPVYAWSYPENINSFLNRLKINNSYIFAIACCASEAGYSIKNLNKIIVLNSGYSISMPNNYIVDSGADSDKVILEKIANAKEKIKQIVSDIKEKKNVFDVYTGKMAFLKSGLINKMFNKYARNTKAFNCDTSLCNGCGLCEKLCPAKTIKLENSNPKWGETCYQCFSCIQRCPREAINLTNTKNRSRYYIEKYL